MKQQILQNRHGRITLLCTALCLLTACKKYLDVKPDKKMVVPSTVQDLQALLDNSNYMNNSYPSVLEIAADNYYVTEADWQARTVDDRNNYVWDPSANSYNNWSGPYRTVFYANEVLDNLSENMKENSSPADWMACKGSALFFRAWAQFGIAQLYAKPYNSATAATDPGIPLRLTADISQPSYRASVQQTYNQITADLQQSIPLLPALPQVKTRPSRAAAYGTLARVFLAMEQYAEAGRYADSCLQLYNTLLNYNNLSATAANPIPRFNDEVIFHGKSPGSSILANTRAKVDSLLVASYGVNDLRKSVFLKNNGNGTYGFKGSYDGTASSGVFFAGIATDEIYLIRAECRARAGQSGAALDDLNTLLQNRWRTGTFTPLQAASPQEALALILAGRRKELLFRGLRWTDLRRLNNDPQFAKTLVRLLGTQTYTLPPGDKRYILLIPDEVITQTNMLQNPR